jgi:hypothetical protein
MVSLRTVGSSGSDTLRKMDMIRGSVDKIGNQSATGWIYSDAQKQPLSVEAVINGEIVGRAVADVPRPDLAAAGFGDGKCGFEVQFRVEIDPLYFPFVQVMLAGTDLELRRWAGAGFREYFTALHRRYPQAGRSASVFGGLWTDRSDALAMLKGRTDIRVVATGDANCLARFIQDGVVIITPDRDGTLQFAGSPTNGELTTFVAKTLFDEEVLKILRAVLDDNPVAVRADAVDSDEKAFTQTSAMEDLSSPAECIGVVFPGGGQGVSVDVVRGGHRFPEFLPDGLSRWTQPAARRTANALLSADFPIDSYRIPLGSAMLVGPGALTRVRAAAGIAIKVLALPARLSVLRFHEKAPRGELTHNSGARIWI